LGFYLYNFNQRLQMKGDDQMIAQNKKYYWFAGLVMAGMLVVAAMLMPSATSMAATAMPATAMPAPAMPATTAMPGDMTSWLGVWNSPTLGNIVVDPKGMTLYVFANDTADTSTCTGSCATLWPPYLVQNSSSPTSMPGATAMPATAMPYSATSMPATAMPAATMAPAATAMPAATMVPGATAMPAPANLDPSLIGKAKLADGTWVVTYNHHPLYHFSKDQKSGDTMGQGVGGLWWTIDTTGKPVSK
jgi:predicted lipoprotein with Yx(FWY)xxD motif